MDEPKLFTVKETAAILRCAPVTVYRLMWSRKLASVKVGTNRRIPLDAINHYLRTNFYGPRR